ncbi:MAG TPA: ATP synthase F1 subunit epsilon [Solirubrobacteraceae bacterium]|jgi:F-type H+-transporting ATPase subunit epsilon
MPHTKFQVEVLTPEGEVFNEEVEMVSTRTTLGEIGILANHEPVLATLEPTELRLYRSDTEIVRFAQSEGYLQVGGNHAMLLVQDAVTPDQLDGGVLRERLAEAERELEGAGEDSEQRRQALRNQRRWQAFLRIVES